jgi:hypothetical protein
MRSDLLGRLNRLALSVLMLISLSGGPVLVQTVAWGSDSPDPAQQLRSLADGIDQYAKAMKPLLSAVDRTRFQTPAVVEQVGKDPAKLLQWVRSNTQYIPYRGCLRGPAGVLMDRMGNSLDRALLLAKLMQEAGVTARLAHGTLDATATEAVSRSTSTTQPAPVAPSTNDEQLIQQIASASGTSVDQIRDAIKKQDLQSQKDREQLVGTVTEQSNRLMELLGPVVKDAPTSKISPADASDHWWVQYSAAGNWLDADPAAPEPGKALCAASETLDLPKDWTEPLKSRNLLHELTIRVRIEQSAPDGRHEFTAMERTFPSAQFTGKSITLTMLPLHWPGDLDLTAPDAVQKMKDALKAQTEWVPLMLVDGQQWYQDGFDDHGTIQKHPSLDSLGQVGGSVAKAGNAVLDAFGGLGNDSPAPAKDTSTLTGAWIEYETNTPGESSPKVIRRDIYDYYGPAKRAAGLSKSMPSLDEMAQMKRSAALYQGIDILPTGCILSQDYVTAQSISDLERMAPILSGALRQAAGGQTHDALKQFTTLEPLPIPLLSLATLRSGPDGIGANHLVIDHLNIFTQRQGLSLRDDGSFGAWKAIDIVANSMTVEAFGGARTPNAIASAIQQGVLDTYMEAKLIGGPRGENVSAMYQASSANGDAPWVLLRKGDDPSKLKLSPDSQARIASDLSAGYVVVVPPSSVMVNQRACEGWWRVDPKTGQTLGIGGSGMGDAMAEYAALVRVLAVYTGVLQFAGCGGISAVQGGNTVKALGCAVCGVAAGVLTYFTFMGLAGGSGAAGKAAAGAAGATGGNILNNACNAWSAAA